MPSLVGLAVQAKVSEHWALRPKQEEARVMSDMRLLQQDYQLLTMVHAEAVKQASHICFSIDAMFYTSTSVCASRHNNLVYVSCRSSHFMTFGEASTPSH